MVPDANQSAPQSVKRLALDLVAYPLLKLLTGKGREVSPLKYVAVALLITAVGILSRGSRRNKILRKLPRDNYNLSADTDHQDRVRIEEQRKRQVMYELRYAIARRIWWRERMPFFSVLFFTLVLLYVSIHLADKYAQGLLKDEADLSLLQTGVVVGVFAVTIPALASFWRTLRMISQGERGIFFIVNPFLAAATIVAVFGFAYLVCGVRYSTCEKGPCNVTTLQETLYFSSITMMTVGYGDIIPSGWSKLLAAVQPMIGVILFGMLVSSLTRIAETPVRRRSYFEFAMKQFRKQGIGAAQAMVFIRELEKDIGAAWFEKKGVWRNFPQQDG